MKKTRCWPGCPVCRGSLDCRVLEPASSSSDTGIRRVLNVGVRNAFFQVATGLTHPLLRSLVRHRSTWTMANPEHALRDWLSPRYAHRHSYNDVLEWFAASGFSVVDVQSPHAYRQLFGKTLWGVGTSGRRTVPAAE